LTPFNPAYIVYITSRGNYAKAGQEIEMLKLTKEEQYKLEDIIGSIYGGVAIALDPIDQKELYNKITARLSEDLKELRTALNLN
jgi:hypothetical protein